MSNLDLIKELRARTGAGILACQKALKETNNDLKKAIDYLRKEGLAKAVKKAGRLTAEGVVGSYIHAGAKLGVLVEVNCETDFVARTPEFNEFVHNIAMHIAANDPVAISKEDVSEDLISKEREVYAEQVRKSGKPENLIEKIVDGMIEKYLKENCLLSQPYVKDPSMNVDDYLKSVIARLGENIVIRRFARFKIGE